MTFLMNANAYDLPDSWNIRDDHDVRDASVQSHELKQTPTAVTFEAEKFAQNFRGTSVATLRTNVCFFVQSPIGDTSHGH
jgi:hypothetical protein